MTEIPALLQSLISQALTLRASDIHLQPHNDNLKVRLRIDGHLFQMQELDHTVGLQLISRIKVLAQLDVAEKRLAQDGKLVFSADSKDYDIRVSTFPTIYGEKAALRILERKSALLKLEELGMDDHTYQQLRDLICATHGFFLVTGPTGAGKTTTVHALLSLINREEKNIVALEDPVEYILEGITQTQVHPEIGLNFQSGLRSLLRQDPDVIMVGEIRDQETARVATQAALTGHLVVSTLHTPDAPGAFMRLLQMHIEPFLVSASVRAILAQRLLRRVCNSCKVIYEPQAHEKELLRLYGFDASTLYKGKGCERCRHTGYYGRIGIFELLVMTPELRSLILSPTDYDTFSAHALKQGMVTLKRDAVAKLSAGLIDIDEFLKL